MGSAARAPMLEEDANAVPDRRDIAGYVSAVAAKPPAPEPRLEPEVVAPQTATAVAQPPMEHLQNAVLQALTDGNQRVLVSMLSDGEWSVQGNELVIKIAESQTVVDMSLSSDAKRLAIASASGVLGRAVKLKVVPGATVAPQENRTQRYAADCDWSRRPRPRRARPRGSPHARKIRCASPHRD